MAKWYDILSKNVTEKVGEFVSEKLVPEEMEWWEKIIHAPMGIFDKKDMEKYDWLGDMSSRGWLGPVNQMGTEEGRQARNDNKGTAKGIKVAETVVPAVIAAIYGGGALMGGGAAAGGAGGTAGTAGTTAGTTASTTGASAGSGASWMQYLKYAKYANMLKGMGGQNQASGGTANYQRYGESDSDYRIRKLAEERIDIDLSPIYM